MAAKELIQTITVGSGGAATIEFTSIPQDGTDLLLVVNARSAASQIQDSVLVRPNGATTNLSSRRLYTSSVLGTAASDTLTHIHAGQTAGNTSTSNTFGSNSIYIPNYAGATNKSVSADGVGENNAATSYLSIGAGLWSSTAAITSLTIVSETGSNWVQYSTASLYKFTKGSGGATVS